MERLRRFQIILEHDETLLNSESWLLNRSEAEFATNGSPKDKGEARSNSLNGMKNKNLK
jgi:hypothetical protein